MAENLTPQNQQDDELSVEELEEAAGGGDTINVNCPCSKIGFGDDSASRPVS